MNYFYFKIPFRTDFSLNEGNILENHSEYAVIWSKLKQSGIDSLNGRGLEIEYLHEMDEEKNMHFESFDKDSTFVDAFSPFILKIKPQNWINEIIGSLSLETSRDFFSDKEVEMISYVEDSIQITLSKNTMSFIDIAFALRFTNSEIDETRINKFEEWSNLLANHIVNYCYHEILIPVIKTIQKFDSKNDHFCESGNHMGFPDIQKSIKNNNPFKLSVKCGIPLWVSRVLIVEEIDEGFDQLINRWIIATKNKEEIFEQLRNQDGDEKNFIYLGWMHSIFIGRIDDRLIGDAFYSLGLAQYFYTVFDSLNQSLSQIIGISHKRRSVKRTRHYKALLEDMIFVTDLMEINFSDISQGLQRNRAYFFNTLVRQWTINNIMNNVRKKIRLCKDNMNKIYQNTFKKSQKVAELLLFFISGFAILEFLSGVSEFLYTPDSISDEVWGLYTIFQYTEPNTVMWIGMLMLSVSFLIYFVLLKEKE